MATMFTRKEYLLLIVALLLISVGLVLMAADPAENGFGILTLWIAPPLLIAGFILPVAVLGFPDFSISLVRQLRPLKWKFLAGVVIFLAAFVVYINTLEPTASLWDCSEFIASSYKLQVPHTPGTPLSLLVGRVFGMMALGDTSRVAWCLNIMSAFFSAMTASLVFYVIFLLGERIAGKKQKYTSAMLFMSSGAGSLCLAYSDTFWFSAVEAETYGPACFFLMLIVWLVLTGRDLEGRPRARRLLLIFYVAGLGYCIHPMCLLALSVLPFVWHPSARKVTGGTVCVSIIAGLLMIMLINRFIAIGLFEVAFSFDHFFVNWAGLPFYSGAIAFLLLSIWSFYLVIVKYEKLRVYVWSLVFLLLGFTPYLMLFIRSNHNPPIDESSPENLPMIKAYMNREGYPTSPLLYGPYFDASVRDVTIKRQVYFKGKDAYEVAGALPEYTYDSRQTLLPRMYSNDPAHIEAYRTWTGLKANEKPGFSDNIAFLLKYQLGHMYLRYLLWNFAGREGEAQNSGWLWPWEKIGSHSPHEKARNQYWMIPLLTGIAGLLVQARRDPKGFITVAILFLITGIILVLYLNSPPNEPRERDYIYVGSYVAFSIWIGMGLLALGAFFSRSRWLIITSILVCAGIPFWMLCQNYDDHDRSGRTFQVDNAKNILRGCAPSSILFTGGDNDTFPLWYVQEVEGFRTDVRVVVLSYLNTDWYINQLRKTYYDSGAFNLSLDEDDYRQYGPNDVLYVDETIKEAIDVKQFLRLLKAEHPALRRTARNGEPYHILPSRLLSLAPTDEAGARSDQGAGVALQLAITENYISKNLLAIMDLIASNGWKRPIYFNFTSMNTVGTDLSPYLIQEGQVYRLTPERRNDEEVAVDTKLTYRLLVEQADYDNLGKAAVHFSYEDYHTRIIVPLRQSFNSLALALLAEGKTALAANVLRVAIQKLHYEHLRPSYTNLQAAEILQQIGQDEMAELLNRQAFVYYLNEVKASHEDGEKPDPLDSYLLRQSAELMARAGDDSFLKTIERLE